jgi:hypothetical protein
MTQDRYMARGKLHTEVAEALNDAIIGAKALHWPNCEARNTL